MKVDKILIYFFFIPCPHHFCLIPNQKKTHTFISVFPHKSFKHKT